MQVSWVQVLVAVTVGLARFDTPRAAAVIRRGSETVRRVNRARRGATPRFRAHTNLQRTSVPLAPKAVEHVRTFEMVND